MVLHPTQHMHAMTHWHWSTAAGRCAQDKQTKCDMLLRQVALQGVPGIKKVSIRETKIMLPDADSGEGFRNENTWVLDTEGTNLLDVSCCPT